MHLVRYRNSIKGCVVWRAKRWKFSRLMSMGIALAGLSAAAEGQGIQTAIEARGRVLPAVGPGVETLKLDASGHYYVLAKPASVIWIYGADGKLMGQIPNAHSGNATIRYAVDFDISPEGKIVVVDRGANAIEVFAPDGSPVARVAVNAPTSVVALSGGQFAVTSLLSKRLVQVLDEQGNYVRSFGDPTEVPQGSDKKALADLGRISGDSTGHIFFAFTTVADPTLRQYDRYGYVAYEATVPEQYFEQLKSAPTDRFELAFNVGRYSLYDESQAWVGIGSSGDLKYGGGVGPGLVSEFNRGGGGGGFGRGGMRGGSSGGFAGAGGFPGGFPGEIGGGPVAGVFSGQMAPNGDSSIEFGMGTLSAGGRRGGGLGGGNSSSESSGNSASLSFYGAGGRSGFGYDPNFMEAYNPSLPDFSVPSDPQSALFGDASLGSSELYAPVGTEQYGEGPGISNAFFLGSTVNSFAYRDGGGGFFGGGNLPAPTTGPLGVSGTTSGAPAGAALGSGAKGATGPGAGAGSGHPMGFDSRYGHGGHFGGGETSVGASVRVNLGDLGTNVADKPIITAIAIDPATQEVWAGIGDTLVHFNKAGEPMEMFSLTLKGGARLHPTAILIEPDRFLIAADPWGVYEFAPPDGPAIGPAPTARIAATPAGTPPPTAAPKQQ